MRRRPPSRLSFEINVGPPSAWPAASRMMKQASVSLTVQGGGKTSCRLVDLVRSLPCSFCFHIRASMLGGGSACLLVRISSALTACEGVPKEGSSCSLVHRAMFGTRRSANPATNPSAAAASQVGPFSQWKSVPIGSLNMVGAKSRRTNSRDDARTNSNYAHQVIHF
jgi:hypothetical protein